MRPIRLMILVSQTAGGGLERTTLTLATGFDRRAIEPSVVLTHSSLSNASLVRSLPADVRLDELDKRGFVDQLRVVRALRRLYQLQRPDVVLSRATYANVVALLARRGSAHRPAVIISEHATPDLLRRVRSYWLLLAARRLYGSAAAFVAVSDGMRPALAEAFRVDVGTITTVHNGYPSGMDDRLAAARASVDPLGPPFDQGAPVILFVGRLTAEKGADDLLRAFALLGAALDARLLVIGDGPLRADLEALATQLGVADRVTFAGYRAYPFREMARADVVVAPSRSEAFSVLLVEAMRCGAAIVATDCDWGPREIITDGHDGLLVPLDNPRALAAAIQRVLKDQELASRLRAAARESSERFTSERMVAAHAALIERVSRSAAGSASASST